jgi:hypothetical protein
MAEFEPVTKQDLDAAFGEIKMLIREVQDVLLAHFHNQLKTHTMRLDARDAADLALLQRLQVMEERLMNLEMRPTARPN